MLYFNMREKGNKNMELTQEQKDIINTVHNNEPIVKINAYAGTGKTTTLVEIVKEIRKEDKNCKILYLVFNRMMADEASRKFKDYNVDCYTAHAFALRRMNMLGKKIKVLAGSGLTNEYFKLKQENPRYKYIAYKKFDLLMTYFTTHKVGMTTFVETMEDYELEGVSFSRLDLEFFKTLYEKLIRENKYTHGMYLKEYALHHHDTIKNYKYVLLDEAQDLNPFMMNIINRIERTKLYVVGDNYQQIYAWNNAINSMDEFVGKVYPLTVSFRFNNEIRDIADLILQLQDSYRLSDVRIKNVHNDTYFNDKEVCILFRTNSAMLQKAIQIVMENNDDVKVHFMDMISGSVTNNFNDTFAEMIGFTKVLLDDCYGENSEVSKEFDNKFSPSTKSRTLQNYIKIAKSEYYDNLFDYLISNSSILSLEYMRYWAIFRMFGSNITEVFEKVRNAELIKDFKKEYTLCTAHRAKGNEWEYVVISSDNWNLDKTDESNLLYVACTRAMRKLDYSEVSNIIEDLREKFKERVPRICGLTD